MSITKLTRVSFGTPKDYKLQRLCHYQSDLEQPNPATNDRITFHLCACLKLVSPVILNLTKINPLKSCKKCFFVSTKLLFWFLKYANFREKSGS